MEIDGILMMVVSFALVLGLAAFCIYRVMRESEPSEHVHGPLDIQPDDVED